MTIGLIIGIGICAFLIVYFAFAWDREEHYLLQLLASFFFVYLLLLIPKAVDDGKNFCETVVSNSTIQGNTTTYEYEYWCETNTRTTATTFYKVIMWFMRLFFIYLFMYFNYVAWLKRKLIDYGFAKPKK